VEKQLAVVTEVLLDDEKGSPSSRASTETPPPPYDVVAPRATLREQVLNFQCILLNTFSTVTIVFMNKT
jgi:hypothetical protein